MIQLSVLMDNNILGFYKGEWGFSVYIEDQNTKILFDTGYSNLFIDNSWRMNINLLSVDYIVLSHGHNDHSHGLKYLIDFYNEHEVKKNERPILIAHPFTIKERYNDNGYPIDIGIKKEIIDENFRIIYTRKPYKITNNIVFLGEIPRKNNFEIMKGMGYRMENKIKIKDYVEDDSGIVFSGKKGIVIISGCAHSGICNMVSYAQELTNQKCVQAVIGGFHLMSVCKKRIDKTIQFFSDNNCKNLYPCHCTDLYSKVLLAKAFSVWEMGVGKKYEFV